MQGSSSLGSWTEGCRGSPVLQDHPVNDLPAGDASPPEKMFTITIEFFIDHHSTTTITPHIDLLEFRKLVGRKTSVHRSFKSFFKMVEVLRAFRFPFHQVCF